MIFINAKHYYFEKNCYPGGISLCPIPIFIALVNSFSGVGAFSYKVDFYQIFKIPSKELMS